MPNDSDHVSVTVVRADSEPSATADEVFRAFADALPDTALMVFGRDLRYQLVAGAGITRFGWRRQDIVGRRPSDFLPPEDATVVEAEMLRVLAGEVRQFERGGVHDPETVWSSTMTPLVTPAGGVVGGMIISREVSGVREQLVEQNRLLARLAAHFAPEPPAASADEIVGWKALLEAKKIAIESEFEWPQGGRSIYIRDPSGNSIEFAEPRIWGI